MRELPEERKQEIISRWLSGDSKEHISASVGLGATTITSVINEWKRSLGNLVAEGYRETGERAGAINPAEVASTLKLMLVLKNLGVRSTDMEEFLSKLAKYGISAGMMPEGLANTVKQIMNLAELDGVEIHQIPAHLEELLSLKKELLAQIEKLKKENESLQLENSRSSSRSQAKDQNETAKTELSDLAALGEKLEQSGLALHDLTNLSKMISSARNYGYDFTKIIDLVTGIKSLEQERNKLVGELNNLRNSEKVLRSTLVSIEADLSKQQAMLHSIQILDKLGFDLNHLAVINESIAKLSSLENLDINSARERFFTDMKLYYSSKGRSGEKGPPALVTEPEQHDYAHKKAPVEMLDRLLSKGITEQVLLKCLIVNDIFKVDIDLLSENLRKYGNLTSAVEGLEETRNRLQAQELQLKHRLVALEEQRQRVVSSTNQLMKQQKPQVHATAGASSAGGASSLSRTQLDEFELLVKAAAGEDVDPTDLKTSLNKTIELFCRTLDENSLTRKILEHAKIALAHESGNLSKN